MGALRIRYTNKRSVFLYNGMRKADWVEKAGEHMALFGWEMHTKPGAPANSMSPGDHEEPTEVPTSNLIFEWVENVGTPQETFETLTLPATPK